MKHIFILLASFCFATLYADDDNSFSVDRIKEFSDTFLLEERERLIEARLIHPTVSPSPTPPVPPTPPPPPPPPYILGYMGVQVLNNTGLPDSSVYFLVKGQNLTNDQCFLQIAGSGLGSYAFVTLSTLSTDFSYRFSDLPGTEGARFFYVPQPFISGRIYFSINYPLFLAMALDQITLKVTIVDPSAFALNDPNYYTLYDKIEFTYNPPTDPGVNIFTNPTAVDFFSLPLRLAMVNPPMGSLSASGLNLTRNGVLTGAQSQFTQFDKTGFWSDLFLPFLDDPYSVFPTVITNMRLIAPSIASAPGASVVNPDHDFPTNYLSTATPFDYITDVWNFYKTLGNQVNINAIEIANSFGPGPGMPAYYHLEGTVDNSDVFTFTNNLAGPNNFTWHMAKPTSCYPFFAGANFVDDGEANNTPGAIIVRQLTSAFDVGLLPVSFSPGNFLDHNYFISQKPIYYTNNPQWGSPGANNGPFYDLYSKALHSFQEPIYTFAYDDALGQDGTLVGNAETLQSSISIAVGVIDTPVPNPYDDSTLYTVAFQAAMNNPVQYRNGTSGPFLAAPAYPGTVSNISSSQTTPFQIKLKDHQGVDQILTVFLKYNIVIPQVPDFSLSSGVVITHDLPTPATLVTLNTPAI